MAGTLRVCVAGGTRTLVKRLIAELADRGHIAIGLTRSREADEAVAAAGGVPRRATVLDRDSLGWAMADADVVVYAPPMSPPVGGDGDGADLDRLRRVGAKNLTIEAGAVGAQRYLQASVVWLVRKASGGPVDEFTPPNPDATTESVLAAERRARAAKKFDLQTATLRTGWVYGAGVTNTRGIARRLLAGDLPVVGRGVLGRKDANLSFVHVDDAAAAFADACEVWETGTYHVVDSQPVTAARLLAGFADRLGAATPRRLPAWLAKHLVGAATARFLSTGFPTSAAPFREDFGWEPTVKSVETGLDRTIRHWREQGQLTGEEGGYEWAGADTERQPRGPTGDDKSAREPDGEGAAR